MIQANYSTSSFGDVACMVTERQETSLATPRNEVRTIAVPKKFIEIAPGNNFVGTDRTRAKDNCLVRGLLEFLFPLVQEPNAGQGRLIFYICRSLHTVTHHGQ